MTDVLNITQHGRVTLFTLNRPDKLNAINRQMALDLQRAFAEFDASDQRVAVIAGSGERAFSSGADVSDLPELWRCIPTVGITTEKPVICAVQGWCVGGAFVMAALADLCVAAEGTRFSYPEARIGLTGGMIAGLAGRIPHKVAMEVMLLGRPLSARRAYEVGLINEVVPDGKQVETALAMAEELAGMAPLVLATLKRFVTEEVLARSPSERMARTLRDLAVVRESADIKEGVAAAKEKRPPVFLGR